MYCCLPDPEHLKDMLAGDQVVQHPLMVGAQARLLPQISVLLPRHWINPPYRRASISTSKSEKNINAVNLRLFVVHCQLFFKTSRCFASVFAPKKTIVKSK